MSDKMAIEQIAKERFGVDLEIKNMIAADFPISHTGSASVFMTNKNSVYVYIFAKSSLALADIQKIVLRIGLRANKFLPPKNRPDYFDEIGATKFRKTYPARKVVSKEDLKFYRTLAPYNPALVEVKEIINGEIKQFDTDSISGWRVIEKYSYRKIDAK